MLGLSDELEAAELYVRAPNYTQYHHHTHSPFGTALIKSKRCTPPNVCPQALATSSNVLRGCIVGKSILCGVRFVASDPYNVVSSLSRTQHSKMLNGGEEGENYNERSVYVCVCVRVCVRVCLSPCLYLSLDGLWFAS